MVNFLSKKSFFHKAVLTSCVAVLSFIPATAQQQVVGAIDGVFNVSDLGGASYTIPIKVPEGINGVQPTLSLNYSSQSGNGILGMGWNLSGLSAITRTGQNIYDDNATKGVALSGDDRLALDGQRLVLTSGSNYGAAGSQYATEVENYKLIKANGTSGSGPLSFTVTDQNGWTFTYGGSMNSIAYSGSNIIAWYISDVKDLNGNTITYTYNNDAVENPTIAEISYNGNSSQGLAYLTKISFSYSDRLDDNFQYIGGKKLSQSKLLTSLSVVQSPSGAAAIIHKYVMEYQMDFYSHLVKVREVGGNNTEEVGSTAIAYNTATNLLIKSQPLITASLGLSYVPGDFNGDGKTDFVVMPEHYNQNYNTWQLVKNTGNSFTLITQGNLPDMSGIYGYSDDELDHKPLYNNNMPAFFNYNGDGYDDFIYRTTWPLENPNKHPEGTLDKNTYHILISDGNTTAPLDKEIKPGISTGAGGAVTLGFPGYFNNTYPLVGDFDGDGKSEVLVLKESHKYSVSGGNNFSGNYLIGENYLTPDGNNGLLAQPLFGMPFDATNLKDPNIDTRVKFFVIDYDGDGKNEILSVWQSHAQVYKLNVTFDVNHKPTVGYPAFVLVNQTGYPTIWHDIFTGDFNGDGITDVLTYGNGGWEFGYGKGNGLMNDEKPTPVGLTNKPSYSDGIVGRPVVIGDFNGDGKDDIFDYTDADDTYGGNAQEPHIFYSLGNNQFQTVYPSNLNSSMNLLSSSLSMYFLGDCNGDGAMDFITRPNIYATQSSFCFHPDEKRHLISKITNGLGAFTKINYASIANNTGVYQTGTAVNTYPVVRKTIPLKVVSSIVEDNGINTTGNATTFKYEGLKFGFWGRGILGFDKVTTTNNVTLASTEKTYSLNTDYFVPQLTSVVNKINGVTVSSSSNTYGIKSFGGKRIFPYISTTLSIDNITQQNTQTTYDYNVPNGLFGPTGFDIGKPNTITTLKGYRNYIGYVNGAFQTVTSQIEKTVQAFTYPNYTLVVGSPLPYQARFLPTRIATTTTRAGDAAYTRYQKLTYNYNKGLLLTSVADPYSGNQAVTTSYAYNGFGNKISESVSASGLPTTTTAYEYASLDPRFCMKTYNTAYPNIFTQYGYNAWTGDLLNKTDPDGLKTNYAYDAFGRLKSTSNNNGQSSTVQYAPATSVPNATYSITSDDNTSEPSVSYYDRLGREIRNTRTGFNGETIIQNTTYNNKGQVVSSSLPYFSTGTAQNTTYHYDIYGRKTSVASPTGTTSYTYTGTPDNTNLTTAGLNKGKYAVKVTDPSGYSKTTTTDASGAAISTEDAGGLLEYAYNSNGGMKTTTLSGQQVQSMTYDAFGRKITETDPNYGSYNYTYNAYGQLLSQKDPAGNIYEYTYNNLGRVATKTGSEGTYTYTYGLTAGANVFKLTKLVGSEGTIDYSYGKGNQLLSEKRSAGSNIFNNIYTYNAVGQLATRTYPDGSKVAYTYNTNDGSCSNIGVPGETVSGPLGTQPAYVYSITQKNAFDEVTQSGFGTFYAMSVGVSPSIIEGKSYNQYGLLTGQSTYPMTYQGPMPNIRSVQYNFSPASGHLTMRKDLVHNLQENFTYDDLKRLKTVAGTPATVPDLNMDYDDNGNINTKSDAGTFAYDPANRVSEIDPYANIPAAKQTLTYTPFKKVKTIKEAGVTATFTYWPDGERASMKIAGGINPRTVYYAPDYEKVVAAGYQREYSYLNNEQGNIAAIIGKDDVTGKAFRYYVLTDYLGSITHVLNTNGSIAEEKSYDAWGRYRNPASWVAYQPTYSNMLFYRGYTGHEHIPEFGIINMNGRLYDPLLGRMFSPDPYIMGNDNTQGYNRYTYALNNPLVYTDPSGNFLGMAFSVSAFLGEFASNLIYGVPDALGNALHSAGQAYNEVSGVGQFNIYSNGNFAITAGFSAFALGVSANAIFNVGNHTMSAGVGYGLLGGGFANVGYNYNDGNWSLSAGVGLGNNYYSYGGSITYKGYGAGYYSTHYGAAIDPMTDGKPHPQTVGGASLYLGDVSIRSENDFWNFKGEDRWRSNGLEIGIGDFYFGTNLYNNDPLGEGSGKYNGTNYIGKYNRGKIWQAWDNGQTYYSPFWVGYKGERIGFSHPIFQDRTQNFIHKWFPPGRQNFYNKYDFFTYGLFLQTGYYNQYTLWGNWLH